MISLGDYSGTTIDARKLKALLGIQVIIQKFEREYLLKQTDDKNYITGLHPIRIRRRANCYLMSFCFREKMK